MKKKNKTKHTHKKNTLTHMLKKKKGLLSNAAKVQAKIYFPGGTGQDGGTLSFSAAQSVCVVYGSVTLGTWGEVGHTELRVSPD